MISTHQTTKLQRSFFETNPLTASQEILGWRLCFHGCEGMVVETEAYAGLGDPACHTFTRPSTRKFVEENPAGTAYVYLNYGVHWLFNVLVKGEDEKSHGFVLFRGVMPFKGIDLMRERRQALFRSSSHHIKESDLCNGPGKLACAFGIGKVHHGIDLFNDSDWEFKKNPNDHFPKEKIKATPRIGISQARDRLWRFVLE